MSEHKAAIDEPGLFDGAEGASATDREKVSPAPAERQPEQAEDRTPAEMADGPEEALAAANERADRLEAEMAELRDLVQTMAANRGKRSRRPENTLLEKTSSGSSQSAARVKREAAEELARAVHGEPGEQGSERKGDQVEEDRRGRDHRNEQRRGVGESGVGRLKDGVPVRSGSSSGESEARGEARSLVEAGNDASSSKQPPSPSSAAGEPGTGGGEEELRRDSMMAHLLDSLDAGEDIGHYGRLVFAMVARHFLSHDEVLGWLTKDEDLGEEEGRQMLLQVEQRDYNPPRRDRILQWQAEQEFPILPNAEDPDCGNVYRNLNFPQEIYQHIGQYREQKAEAGE